MSRKVSTRVAPLVQKMLYPTFKGTIFTSHGLAMESVTIKEYELKKAENVYVQKSGMVICEKYPELAASPDGVVVNKETGESGLVELKNLLHNKPISLQEAAKQQASFCLRITNEHTLKLKENHKYYYQCQGLLHICDKEWIDLVVRTERPNQLHIERIQKDNSLWENCMLPKLLAFYNQCLLPELAAPRYKKYPGIREPQTAWVRN